MSNKLLRINASARSTESVTRTLADQIVSKLAPAELFVRDLNDPIPQLNEEWINANFTPADERNHAQKSILTLSDRLISEVKNADTLLLAVPIYNFGVPSSLKSWFDHIARAGITFNYTETGPVGTLDGKRAIVAIASGGTEVDGPIDFATPWIRHALGFVGITDVQIVRSDLLMVDAKASQARATYDLNRLVA